MRDITHLILHCTDSTADNVESVRRYHKYIRKPPFRDIGYHFLILNAYPTFESLHDGSPEPKSDGVLGIGRPIEEVGAHALGWNEKSIGICLVGRRGTFTGAQIQTAVLHCRELAMKFQVPFKNVIGHYETGAKKTCPDLDMDWFREQLIQGG